MGRRTKRSDSPLGVGRAGSPRDPVRGQSENLLIESKAGHRRRQRCANHHLERSGTLCLIGGKARRRLMSTIRKSKQEPNTRRRMSKTVSLDQAVRRGGRDERRKERS